MGKSYSLGFEHNTAAPKLFDVPEHGSPKAVVVAESEHDGRPAQAVVASARDAGAAHDGLDAKPEEHVPVGVPNEAKETALMLLPASQLRGSELVSATRPHVTVEEWGGTKREGRGREGRGGEGGRRLMPPTPVLAWLADHAARTRASCHGHQALCCPGARVDAPEVCNRRNDAARAAADAGCRDDPQRVGRLAARCCEPSGAGPRCCAKRCKKDSRN